MRLSIYSAGLAFVTFVATAVAAIALGWYDPVFLVEIRNESAKPIQSIEIGTDSNAMMGSFKWSAQPHPVGANAWTRTFGFYTDHEASYKMTVTFNDGTSLRSSEYIQGAGARVIELIYADKVCSYPQSVLNDIAIWIDAATMRRNGCPRQLRHAAFDSPGAVGRP